MSASSSSYTYEQACHALQTDHQSTTPAALAAAAQRRKHTLRDMERYLCRVQLALPVVPVIHIAGTKGKGSVVACCQALLSSSSATTTTNNNTTVVSFTSPHLIHVNERIRFNGRPCPEQVFAQAYSTVRTKLEDAHHDDDDDLPILPGYFRMLVLLFVQIVVTQQQQQQENMVLIVEVGMGGRYDATNIFNSTACGVTVLDYDHTRILGTTLEEIAWEKGGIFKQSQSSPCNFFALRPTRTSVAAVLEQCAAEANGTVQFIHAPVSTTCGLAGTHQGWNAALAVALCTAVVGAVDLERLATVSWPGRCQRIPYEYSSKEEKKGPMLFLDGAHTPQSMSCGLAWYNNHASNKNRVLIFYCSHERNPVELMQLFHHNNHSSSSSFAHVFILAPKSARPSPVPQPTAAELLVTGKTTTSTTTTTTTTDNGDREEWTETLVRVWNGIHDSTATVATTVSDVVQHVPECADIFVTGSLYLVGTVLAEIGWSEPVAVL